MKNNFGPNGEFYDVHFLDESNGFAVGRDGIAPNYFGIIEKTNDGGDTWTSLNVGSAPILFEVAFIDSLFGFAVGDSGTIIKTIDAGLNWTPIVSVQQTDSNRFSSHLQLLATYVERILFLKQLIQVIHGHPFFKWNLSFHKVHNH